MNNEFYQHITNELEGIEQAGMTKHERLIKSPQDAEITLDNGKKVLNFCANNYLGLSNHPTLIQTASAAIKEYGYGMSSVRFICGTQTIHRELEVKIANFLQMEDCILYASCFDANAGLFETLLTAEDAIISDQLNHASIIDGVRLCKAKRYRYANNDMAALEEQLIQADKDGVRFKLIATDGVFSMDGIIANLPGVCDLADKYNALVMVDDSHATGFIGDNGRGTPEYHHVIDRIDIMTGTLGKGLGGASGGYTCAKSSVVDMLKQRSRPYLFSNAVAPAIVKTSIAAIELVESAHDLRAQLQANAKQFREGMEAAGFDLVPGEHPIIPVMLYEERKAAELADKLLDYGVYVIAFSYPVVPKGLARIRTQMSAAHTSEQVTHTVEAFIKARADLEG